MCSYLDPSQLLSLVETHFGKAEYLIRESSREGSTLEMRERVIGATGEGDGGRISFVC